MCAFVRVCVCVCVRVRMYVHECESVHVCVCVCVCSLSPIFLVLKNFIVSIPSYFFLLKQIGLGENQMTIMSMKPVVRKEVLRALNKRWVLAGGVCV